MNRIKSTSLSVYHNGVNKEPFTVTFTGSANHDIDNKTVFGYLVGGEGAISVFNLKDVPLYQIKYETE